MHSSAHCCLSSSRTFCDCLLQKCRTIRHGASHEHMQCPGWNHAVRCCSIARLIRTRVTVSMSAFVPPRGLVTSANPFPASGSAGSAAACQSGLVGRAPRASTSGRAVAVCSGRGLWLPEAAPPPQPQVQWGWRARAGAAQRESHRGIHATAAVELEISQTFRSGDYDASQIQVREFRGDGIWLHRNYMRGGVALSEMACSF